MRARCAVEGAIGLLILWSLWAPRPAAAGPSPRVMSLDQCADQYVLALSPRAAIVGLSPRARAGDSLLAPLATGLPIRRADSESALASRPRVVVRYWGGDPPLLRTLTRRGVRVVTIDDATDFSGVRRDVRRVAAALGEVHRGERLIRRMNAQLAASRGAWGGRGALYLTSGGATAGSGTLIDAMLAAAGLRNLASGPGFRAVSLERLVSNPPAAVVEGFFDAPSQARVHWGPGRHGALRRVTSGRALVSLPGSLLGCPAWFAADAVRLIANAAPAGTGRCATGRPMAPCA